MADKQTVELDDIILDLAHQASMIDRGVTINAGMFPKQQAQLNQLLIKAELKGFLTGYDCHDYPRLREYKANLENQLGEKS